MGSNQNFLDANYSSANIPGMTNPDDFFRGNINNFNSKYDNFNSQDSPSDEFQGNWDIINSLTRKNDSFQNIDDLINGVGNPSRTGSNNVYNPPANGVQGVNTNVSNGNNNNNDFDENMGLDDLDEQFVNNLLGGPTTEEPQSKNAINLLDDIIDSKASPTNYPMENRIDSISSNTDAFSNPSYQSPVPISSRSAATKVLKNEAFSPQSLGFSTAFGSNLGKTISNQLGRSYGSQLGTSLNNLVSPSSTYDGFDSEYGSYNDEGFKSPMNSPSLKSFGSPSAVGGTPHFNPKHALSKESKLSRRRELHNAVERRRRDLIKEKIKELGSLIPPTMLYDPAKQKSSNKEIKANKNMILQKSVEYISYLQKILEAQDTRLSELQEKIEGFDLNDPILRQDYDMSRQSSSQPKMISNDHFDLIKQTNNISINGEENPGLSALNPPDAFYDDARESPQQRTQDNREFTDLRSSLAVFSENVNINSENSKLRFMDFSNDQIEPVDFNKLPQQTNKLDDESFNNLINFDVQPTSQTQNKNYQYPTRIYNDTNDEFKLDDEESKSFNTTPDLNKLLDEPTAKFDSDADFLDHLLSVKPQ